MGWRNKEFTVNNHDSIQMTKYERKPKFVSFELKNDYLSIQ